MPENVVVKNVALQSLDCVSVEKKRVRHTFYFQMVGVFGIPLCVLGYALVLAAVTFRDITEAQESVKHFFECPGFIQLTFLLQPRNFRSWTEEEESQDTHC